MREILFRTELPPRHAPWATLHEAQVVGLVEDSLADAFGSWEVTLVFTGTSDDMPSWVVDCRRAEDHRRLRMHLDPTSPKDASAFRAALGSLGAKQDPTSVLVQRRMADQAPRNRPRRRRTQRARFSDQ